MLFQKKVNRAFDYASEQAEKRNEASGKVSGTEERGAYVPCTPELKDIVEKGDVAAMIISALLVIVPVGIVVLLVMIGFSRLLFRM